MNLEVICFLWPISTSGLSTQDVENQLGIVLFLVQAVTFQGDEVTVIDCLDMEENWKFTSEKRTEIKQDMRKNWDKYSQSMCTQHKSTLHLPWMENFGKLYPLVLVAGNKSVLSIVFI